MAGVDFIEEIRIAQYWRKQLGEYEYVNHNAEDLRRWYHALELRGPAEIRDYLTERTGRYPMGTITGIVAKAPHPSREIVQLWLESHERVKSGRVWLAGLTMFVFIYLFATNLHGCMYLSPQTRLQMHPPAIGGNRPAYTGQLPQAPSTLPQPLPQPAQNAARPTGIPNQGSQPR